MARNEGDGSRRSLLGDLSVAQVVGTALAAVTSMLLSSYIGIAGSIIGVAAASVVSTVCASLYKNFLAASAEKLKEIPQVVQGATGVVTSSASSVGSQHSATPDDVALGDALAAPDPVAPDVTTPLTPAASAAPMSPAAAAHTARAAGHATATPHLGDEGALVDGAVLAQRDARLHRARMRRGVVVVAVVSALVAVALSAAAVWVFTMGEGLGAKPAPVHIVATQKADDSAKQADADATDDQQAADSAATTGDSSDDAGTAAASGAAGSGDATSGAASGDDGSGSAADQGSGAGTGATTGSDDTQASGSDAAGGSSSGGATAGGESSSDAGSSSGAGSSGSGQGSASGDGSAASAAS